MHLHPHYFVASIATLSTWSGTSAFSTPTAFSGSVRRRGWQPFLEEKDSAWLLTSMEVNNLLSWQSSLKRDGDDFQLFLSSASASMEREENEIERHQSTITSHLQTTKNECGGTSAKTTHNVKFQENHSSSSTVTRASATKSTQIIEAVPTTWKQALTRFFLQEPGPPLVILSILYFIIARITTHSPLTPTDTAIFSLSIFFWTLQEYFLHKFVLHSKFHWIGKEIHRTRHNKPYFHVSIDPPALLLGWLFTVHILLRMVLPWNLCLTATVGYATAGLVYEWSHYIVHTKVRAPFHSSSGSDASERCAISTFQKSIANLFLQMRDNHMRHHLVDDEFWFAFSLPVMDDVFGSNPDVREVKKERKKERSE
mmetsp:Transcript_8880/g.18942  ORF Transcript_8880/g.18942 Transcript_8880/m.18942 type:complete len:369 (-) Transcript_8880:229-1335(-)